MATKLKDHTIITTRDFVRNLSRIENKPTSKRYTVVKHGKPVLLVIPLPKEEVDDFWSTFNPDQYPEAQQVLAEPKKHLTLAELRKKYSFYSGEKHLSQRIDEIVYGISR